MRTVERQIKGGRRLLIDAEDEHLIAGRQLRIHSGGYPAITDNHVSTTVHSLVMGGARPGSHIDHINGDRFDCRKANLRFVSPSLNQVNRKRLNRNNTSGVRGVSRSTVCKSKPWRARIAVNNRSITLGYFASIEEARSARMAAELQYFGEACPTSTAQTQAPGSDQ